MPSVNATIVTYWLCAASNCSHWNPVKANTCETCKAAVCEGAFGLNSDYDKIAECDGADAYGRAIWALHDPDVMDLTEARASTRYRRD
ncbi:hypothetical protein FBEOM_11264 [Fusarium beomiforme]|uniref:RanBP2-type domain-containing protein n=1 Tax=Fusarium beomiforme TaxID=44412 RepID=A0A9P5DU58_9HYPO|nr:hypothetical protein FBEOM_11264 [Fusarium beomiforme]